MPFWIFALLSGLLFICGLLGGQWGRGVLARAMALPLMLQAAFLLLLAADREFGACDGQTTVLLGLGTIPAVCAITLLTRRRPPHVKG